MVYAKATLTTSSIPNRVECNRVKRNIAAHETDEQKGNQTPNTHTHTKWAAGVLAIFRTSVCKVQRRHSDSECNKECIYACISRAPSRRRSPHIDVYLYRSIERRLTPSAYLVHNVFGAAHCGAISLIASQHKTLLTEVFRADYAPEICK